MPYRDEELSTLYNGVSQQPAALRDESQAEECINIWPTVADGVRKRSGSEHIKRINGNQAGKTLNYFYLFEYSADKKYIIYHYFNDPTPTAVDLYTGNIHAVVDATGGDLYLQFSGPTNLSMTSVGDNVIVATNRKTPAMDAAVTPGVFTATVQTFNDLPALSGLTGGEIYHIKGSDGTNFDDYYVRAVKGDTSGGQNASDYWEEYKLPGAQDAINPATMPHVLTYNPATTQFVWDVATWGSREVGDLETNPEPEFIGLNINDVFYHRGRLGFLAGENFILSDATDPFRFWRSTATALLNTDTISVSSATKINAVLHSAVPFDRALVGFSESAQFSLRGEPLLTPYSADVDIDSEYDTVTTVKPIVMGNNMYFLSETNKASQLWELFVDPDSQRLDARDITTVVPRYYDRGATNLTGSSTAGAVFMNTRKDDLGNRQPYVDVYKSLWSGSSKLQGAPFKFAFGGLDDNWPFPGTIDNTTEIVGLICVQDDLYIISLEDGQDPTNTNLQGMWLSKIPLSATTDSDQVGNSMPWHVHLDRKEWVQGTYSDVTNLTTFTISSVSSRDKVCVLGPAFNEDFVFGKDAVGNEIDVTKVDDFTYTAVGDWTPGYVCFGEPYEMVYEFTEPVLKDKYKKGQHNIVAMIKRWGINYTDTGYMKVRVKYTTRGSSTVDNQKEHEFVGKRLGDGLTIGSIIPDDGTFVVPVNTKSDRVRVEVVSDSYLPVQFSSAYWQAIVNPRRRIL